MRFIYINVQDAFVINIHLIRYKHIFYYVLKQLHDKENSSNKNVLSCNDSKYFL